MNSETIKEGIVAAVGAAGIIGGGKSFRDYFTAICGHPAESIGTMLGKIGRDRIVTGDTVFQRAHFISLDIGLKVKPIPNNILQPLAEGASLQDDPTLQEVWANLIANAGNAESQYEFKVSYISIVRELSSREAIFLQKLFAEATKQGGPRFFDTRRITERSLWQIFEAGGLAMTVKRPRTSPSVEASPEQQTNSHNFAEMLDILQRVGIIKSFVVAESVTAPDPHRYPSGRVPALSKLAVKNDVFYAITELGWSVIHACQLPQKQADTET